VALAAVRGDRSLAQLAEQFDVYPNQITSWKAQLEGGAADVFGPGGSNGADAADGDRSALSASAHHQAGAWAQDYPYLLRGIEITRPNQVWAMSLNVRRQMI
jgi:hypothetical protein